MNSNNILVRFKNANKKWFIIGILVKIFKKFPMYFTIRTKLIQKHDIKHLKEWEQNGRKGSPPHIIKEKVLKEYAKKFNLKTLVETGTYYGDMINALKEDFGKIYTVELDEFLFKTAKKRFAASNHIEVIHGDSGEKIKEIIQKINRPTLFWLDGHASGGETAKGEKDTPIYEELNVILKSKNLNHVIIIDDARCFGNEPDYPTLDELKKFIFSKRDNLEITVEFDSIRIIPKIK
jgi:hypothetical protein